MTRKKKKKNALDNSFGCKSLMAVACGGLYSCARHAFKTLLRFLLLLL